MKQSLETDEVELLAGRLLNFEPVGPLEKGVRSELLDYLFYDHPLESALAEMSDQDRACVALRLEGLSKDELRSVVERGKLYGDFGFDVVLAQEECKGRFRIEMLWGDLKASNSGSWPDALVAEATRFIHHKQDVLGCAVWMVFHAGLPYTEGRGYYEYAEAIEELAGYGGAGLEIFAVLATDAGKRQQSWFREEEVEELVAAAGLLCALRGKVGGGEAAEGQ